MTELSAESKHDAAVTPAEENISQTQASLPQQKATDGEEKQEDPNWRAFREARKKDRAEKEAAERRASEKEAEVAALKAAMEAAFSKSAPAPQAYQQYYGQPHEEEETEDQRIEKKVNALLASREEKYRQEMEHRERSEYPSRLAREFPDFGQVCSQENLDYLDYHFPELSRPLQRLPDGYDKWSDIYRAVKKFIPNVNESRKDASKADSNALKPRSISSTAITQPGQGGGPETWQQSEQRRTENWARMQRIMKGV